MFRIRRGIILFVVLITGVLVWQHFYSNKGTLLGSSIINEQQKEFRRYAIEYYPISDLEYHGGNEIWVRLRRGSKRESVDVQRIVDDIASDYQTRMGNEGPVSVFMLHPIDQGVIAKSPAE